MLEHGRIEEVEKNLRGELERTQAAYKTARSEFRSITRDVPSGIPHPDGTLRIEQSAQAYRLASEAYVSALKRFSAFAVNRIIPDDLKRLER